MALRKEVTDKRGIKAEYHRLMDIRINANSGTTSCVLASYTSKKVRDEDPAFHVGDTRVFTLDGVPKGDPFAFCYAGIKAQRVVNPARGKEVESRRAAKEAAAEKGDKHVEEKTALPPETIPGDFHDAHDI